MKKRQFLRDVGLMSVAFALPGCALMFTGSKEKDERGDIQVGFLLLDLALVLGFVAVTVNGFPITVPLGILALIMDFSTGAIYKRASWVSRDQEEDEDGDEDEDEDGVEEEEEEKNREPLPEEEEFKFDDEDDDQGANLPVRGRIPLALCDDIGRHLMGLREKHTAPVIAQAMAEHVRTCPTCASAFVRATVQRPRGLMADSGAPRVHAELVFQHPELSEHAQRVLGSHRPA